MRVAIAYCFPQILLTKYMPLAQRFAASYMRFAPGGYPHELYVIANGYQMEPQQQDALKPLPFRELYHTNYGRDIGGFITAAHEIPCDLLICMGAHIYFRRAGWLDRIVNTYLDNGPGIYGPWGFHAPALHLRTTCFWLPPELLTSYPHDVSDHMRYAFEHGHSESIVAHAKNMGFPRMMVTWSGVYHPPEWHHVENADCLMLDQHTDSIGYR